MGFAHLRSALLLVSVLIFTASCDGGPKTPKTQPRPASGLASDTLEVTPLADAGAYANDLDGAVWYVREGRGVRVTGLPEKVQVADITPTADGGAYMTGSGLWYLHEGTAIRVQEGPVVPGSALAPRDKWLWAVVQAERRWRRNVDNATTDYRDER